MIICDPDCPDRLPGCADHCEKYKEKRKDYEKRMKYLKDAAFNPYCRHKRHRDIVRDAKGE